jgi:hypothetical protein
LRSARWLAGLPDTPEFNILIFSFLLNLPWEVWQVPFFRGMADRPHWEGIVACTRAAFGDAGISLASFWMVAAFVRTRSWILKPRAGDILAFTAVGVAATIVLEYLATGSWGRWAYNDAMPRVPVLGTGLVPLLQWLILAPVVLWLIRRQIGAKGAGAGQD